MTAPSAAALIWRSSFLRAAFAALLLSGIAVSATTPQMTLFLVGELGASAPVAGAYYLVNLLAPLTGYWLGNVSDRHGDRLPLYRICVGVGGIGWLTMALASQIWMPFLIGAVALSISGASMGLLFAAVRDHLSRHATPASTRVISAIRMAFTAGWILGPVLGSWFGAVYGLRPLLVATAVLMVGQIAALGRQQVPRYLAVPASSSAAPSPAPARSGPVADRLAVSAAVRTVPSRLPLFGFVGCCVLVMNGDTVKFAFLPLYLADQLQVSDTLRGAVIAIQPLLELALMPLFARLAEVITPIWVVTIGAAFGVAANLAYATSEQVAGLFVGQILMSGLWAAMAGLGVTVAQQLYPTGVGLASSVFMSSVLLSAGLGGAIGGIGTALLGVPHVFYVSAVLAGLGTAGLVVISSRWSPGELRPIAEAHDAGVPPVRRARIRHPNPARRRR
ncbi:MAG: MFS transporter [Microlunatus sp.]|nr:MFS transporter [Microlunatus sp.]MDN5771214.1 MFS transporter [Microlunatus sp.]